MTVGERPVQDLELIYEGSVKRVYQSAEDKGKLYFEFTDDYSVFDWGKMPDTIENKGRALASMGAFFFKELNNPELFKRLKTSEHLKRFDPQWLRKRFDHVIYSGVCGIDQFGMPNHFAGLIENDRRVEEITSLSFKRQGTQEKLYLEVLKAEVERPETHVVDKQVLYFYPHTYSIRSVDSIRKLVPLEIVFRFGMPEGSSLKERLEKDPSYLHALGLEKMPKEGEWLPQPVIEFFTKLEPKDRLLSHQEAVHVSGLGSFEFEYMKELSYDIALALYVIFAERGIELWDGKIEMIVDYKGHEPCVANSGLLMLADSIGPDELRLLYRGVHLSKELIRRIYRGTPWEKALKESQEMAKKRGVLDWKKICTDELGQTPAPLDTVSKNAVNALYPALTNHIIGTSIFEGQPTLDAFVDSLPAALKEKKK